VIAQLEYCTSKKTIRKQEEHFYQKVLNDLYKARLSRGRMIWLPPPSLVRKLNRRHTGRLRKRDDLLTGERRRGGGGAESCERKKLGPR
jgi:hypothetical protein